jgi:hypothetical protein
MTFQECEETLAQCQFPGYMFRAIDHGSFFLIVAEFEEADVVSLLLCRQETRYWILFAAQPKETVISTCFKMVMTSVEHETREKFTYQNKPIYQPHHNIEKLLLITETRPPRVVIDHIEGI